MSLEIETKEAVAALQSAAKECGDVLAASNAEPGQSTEGRGYAFIASRLDDAMRVINNVLKDIGEAPSLPAAPPPKEVTRVETVTETVDNPETQAQLDAALAKIDELQAMLSSAAERQLNPAEAMIVELPDEPPEEVAELIHENEAYGAAQERLQAEYNALTNKIELGLASDSDQRKHGRLHGAIEWLRRKGVETV